MSSAGQRSRILPVSLDIPSLTGKPGVKANVTSTRLAVGKQSTASESHRRDPKTGHYDAGGPFYTSRVTWFINPGAVSNAVQYEGGVPKFWYSGPVLPLFPTGSDMKAVGFTNLDLNYGSVDESKLKAKGTTAISLASPINPTSNLGTTLAETFREGIPSLPGIQSWKRRTEILKGLGSEYLNQQFGWAPLRDEVSSVRDTARHHRDLMKQYQDGEGRNTRRRFDFTSSVSSNTKILGSEVPLFGTPMNGDFASGVVTPQREVSMVRETKCWFVGCYTYGGPSHSDSWRKALGFGSQADQLFGIALTPDVLWELTPWSWAVDWFSNAGDVINNVTNFGLAGLVLRYGYMMEESIERITATVGKASFYSANPQNIKEFREVKSSPCSCGVEVVTKVRVPASPFGFSIGWEGLSPTQLAITAALGITRLL